MKIMKLRLICLAITIAPTACFCLTLEIRFQNLMNLRPSKDIERVELIGKQKSSGISIFAFSELMSKRDEKILLDSLNGDILIRSKKSFQSVGVVIKGQKLIEQIKVWEIDDRYKRPIFLLKINLKNQYEFYVLVNHWPSQRSKSKKRFLYLNRLTQLMPYLTGTNLILVGDFNTNKQESLKLKKVFFQFYMENPLIDAPTYYFAPYNRFYSFDQIWVRGFRVMEKAINKKYSKKILINSKEFKIPDKKKFDHFELYLKLAVD